MTSRRPSHSLRFIIVGGSIAGLSCAYALREVGHQVLVLEQSDGTYRSHGGIRSPPNMTRLLNYWGLGPALAKVSMKGSQFTFKDGESGDTMGLLILHEKLMKALQAEFLFIQHGDLHTLFYDLAVKNGVLFRYESKVTTIDPWAGTVTLQTGAKFSADVIVGADGYKSVVRPIVVGPQALRGIKDRRVSVNLTIPTELMRQDEDLAPLAESSEWTLWVGDNCCIHALLVSSKREYGMVIHLPFPLEGVDEHWNEHISIDDLAQRFENYEPRIRKLLKLCSTITPTLHVIHEPFDNWVHESGKVVLVGEAAHPLMPNGSHNAALAVEDAMTLSTLFALPLTPAQTPLLLSAYEELRQARCAATQASERQKRDFVCLPHGPEQRARDEGFRQARKRALLDWDEADEDFLRETWEEYIELFGFDAREAVEDWWTKWGGAMMRKGDIGGGHGEVEMGAGGVGGGERRVQAPTYEVSVMRDGVMV
ncbi:hypothetical protein SERLA73DRAFT_114656 [Serpula lacrymans var. lacrymans S7.3]|uniref:FAD-binding domain-containing protein n=2 Tax=Serpula lacrymans var. lacrymans TaxID=341189 RepID=F8QB46_SERL3|nr:uncharacterized protein SERLADRAFT_453241 [Serpula lacrymans var. lacrymans S7.9]EGN94432.1 hypothetical protein SERLA73DRAFT_114656 [Serpula lacrymans var. lacrymans S7.3]EGO19919.1 hypothetical protein SERLADRAFT_453241 [Serpula lacrymans var. lacrymans S7.9]